MRSLWVSLSMLFFIIAYSFTVTLVMERQISKMESSLSLLEKTTCENAREESENLEHVFYRFRALFSISLPMEDIDGIEESIILLKNAQKSKNGDAYRDALSSLRFALYRMRDAAMPSWETVF